MLVINANNLPKQAKSSTEIIEVYTRQQAFKALPELSRTYFSSFMPQLHEATVIAEAEDHPVFSFFALRTLSSLGNALVFFLSF